MDEEYQKQFPHAAQRRLERRAAHVEIPEMAKQQIIDYLKKHHEVSNAEIAEDLNLPFETVQIALDQLVKEGVVKNYGSQFVCPFCGSSKTPVINARFWQVWQLP